MTTWINHTIFTEPPDSFFMTSFTPFGGCGAAIGLEKEKCITISTPSHPRVILGNTPQDFLKTGDTLPFGIIGLVPALGLLGKHKPILVPEKTPALRIIPQNEHPLASFITWAIIKAKMFL